MRGTLIGLLIAVVAAVAGAQPPATRPADALHVVFLHINDVHGQTQGVNVNGKTVGGYARLTTAVDKVRREEGLDKVFLIHTGDEFSKGDKLTITSKGAANVELMNQQKIDLWVPGNGEFYNGLTNLRQLIGRFNGKVLGGNLLYKADDKPLLEPYTIEQIGDLKVAFLGLCFIRMEHPSALFLRMQDPVETANKFLPEIRGKADLVVAVTHIGFNEDQQLAAKTSGIDLIIGAHSHTLLPQGQRAKDADGRPVLIVQAGEFLKQLGRADVTLNRVDGRWQVRLATSRMIPLDQTVQEDPVTKALIARLAETGGKIPATQPAK